MTEPKLLWPPTRECKANTQLRRFMDRASERTGRSFDSFEDIRAWSVGDLEGFWSPAWEVFDLKLHRAPDAVLQDPEAMPRARFFPDG